MTQLPHAIELHDSTLAAIRRESNALVLELRPAYMHRDGAGWSQDADLHLSEAVKTTVRADLPSWIWDGRLETSHGVTEGLLPLPLDAAGPVRLVCDLVTGARIDVTAEAIRIALLGEARFIERVG